VLRILEQVFGVALFDDLAGIHHDDALAKFGDHAEVVGDHDDGRAEVAVQPNHQVQDLGLDRDVERGRRLVRDQQPWSAGQGNRDHHALAHPAGELVGIGVHPVFGGRDADPLEQIDRPLLRLLLGDFEVKHQRLDQLVPNRVDRIERRHRVLEDHRDVITADVSHLPVGQRQEVSRLAVDRKGDRTVDDSARRARHQPHQAQGGDALAAARFAHDAEGFAFLDMERDIVDGEDHARAGEELRLEVLHLEDVASSARLPGLLVGIGR
jgi:hypothetical protein